MSSTESWPLDLLWESVCEQSLDGSDDPDAESLDPERVSVSVPPVVLASDGSVFDGWHRLSGMVAWCRRRGIDLGDVQVPCIELTFEETEALANRPLSPAELERLARM